MTIINIKIIIYPVSTSNNHIITSVKIIFNDDFL